MRIAIDASPIFRPKGGIGWYTYHLVKYLMRIDQENEYFLYTTDMRDEGGEHLGGFNRNVRVVLAPKAFRGWRGVWDRIDLYHGTNYRLPVSGSYRKIVTIYDMALARFPEFSRKLFGEHWSFLRTRQTVQRADQVITVSQHAAKEIQELFEIPCERIAVIYGGVDEGFFPEPDPIRFAVLRERYGIHTDAYILAVGGSDPRKNLHTLLQAYHRLSAIQKDYTLVVVGGIGGRGRDIYESITTLKLQNRMVLTGYASVADLRVLYSMAALFVYPSLYEGFGLPPLEAMACGAPVITSNTSSFPEVVGNAALQIDPRDPDGLADAMNAVLEDESLAAGLRASGFDRVKCFSWERAARETLQVYHRVGKR
ncbi:MAG: glycosyltransferase family 4 protein [Nitrospiria bacterium]